MKKLIFLLFASLVLVACGNGETYIDETNDKIIENEDNTEVNEINNDSDVNNEEDDKPDLKTEAEANANEHPATPGKKLFDEEFKGMNYYFKGNLVKTELVEGLFGNMEEALLVKNENGYILVIFPPYEIDVAEGDEIEAWGPLSGDGYASTDLEVDNVVAVTGAMNASLISVNGEMK